MDDINARITECFNNLGIAIDTDENSLISDYIVDSITYIAMLSELEQLFEINIPDEYLIQGRLTTYQDLYHMISDLVC